MWLRIYARNISWLIGILLALSTVACTALVEEESPTATVESPTLQISDTATPDTSPSTPSADTEQVELLLSKKVYQLGETVSFTITNNLNRDIFYTVGFVRVEGTERFGLLQRITEEEIPPRRLSAGESISGAWDQIAFWAPDKEGSARFTDITAKQQVPPGEYQVVLQYALTEEAIKLEAHTVFSRVFTIVE